MDAGPSNSRPLIWRNHYGNRGENRLNNRQSVRACNSRPRIWRNQYGKRCETQLENQQYNFANKRRKQVVDAPIPMEIDECMNKHSATGPSNFGGSPLNWQRNSAIHFGGRPDGNRIFPSCPRVLNSRQKFRQARSSRCRNQEYSTEHDGTIARETLDNGNREADLPLIVCQPPEINRRFTWMRRWDECTQSEASSSPCSARFHGLDSDPGDYIYERMDIDNDGEDAVFRALLGDIQEKLGDLDVYTADDVSEHCTQPLERLSL